MRGIADLADELDLGRSTTHRYASTLVLLGYLEQDGPSRKYRLSPRACDVGLSSLDTVLVRWVAREHLRSLRDKVGCTVTLAVLDTTEVAYVDRWQGSRQGQYAIDQGIGVGTRVPTHCSAAGKAFLASLPAAERQLVIGQLQLVRHGPKSITRKRVLLAELEQAEDGLACEDEGELRAGRRAIACAVAAADGRTVAAVEIAAPAELYTREELTCLAPKLTSTANHITRDLNGRHRPIS